MDERTVFDLNKLKEGIYHDRGLNHTVKESVLFQLEIIEKLLRFNDVLGEEEIVPE